MSKAFTREDDAPDEALLQVPPRLLPGQKRYITPAGYESLKNELAGLLASKTSSPRVRWLQSVLSLVTVLNPGGPDDGRIRFGARVVLEDEDGETRSYRIVGPDEADARKGLLSVDSPLARALLGKEEGDMITWSRPHGDAPRWTPLSVVAVSYDR